MPDLRRKKCKGFCGRTSDECGPLSWLGYCFDCGAALREANILQLRAHDGPFFDHWRRRSAASYGAVLLDDLAPTP